ncbi:MAG: hypothetical protein K6F08_02925 [bacterium]|nr:hypothetical protein [bacterium]
MKKTSLVKYLNTSESVVFLCATVFVIFFLLWGINTLLIFALASYVLAFTLMTFESIVNISALKDNLRPKKVETEPQIEQGEAQENNENANIEEEIEAISPEQIKATKKGIVWQSFRLVFSLLIAVFSLVVLIIY